MAAAKAKASKVSNVRSYIKKSKKRRAGIHSKKKASKSKSAKHYHKRYRGQGR